METVNINARIRVTLSKEGAEAINTHNSLLVTEITTAYPSLNFDLKIDYKEGDIVEDSLWSVFEMLGDYLSKNTSAPFKNNEITFID